MNTITPTNPIVSMTNDNNPMTNHATGTSLSSSTGLLSELDIGFDDDELTGVGFDDELTTTAGTDDDDEITGTELEDEIIGTGSELDELTTGTELDSDDELIGIDDDDSGTGFLLA